MDPKKPFYLDNEGPDWDERAKCVSLNKAGLSGPLGAPYMHPIGPQSQADYDRHVQQQDEIRAQRGGLPDSSPEMPPKAVSSKPFKL